MGNRFWVFCSLINARMLSACGDEVPPEVGAAADDHSRSANSGSVTVTLNGQMAELEPWPVSCGVTQSGIDMAAKGGLPDGDSDPGNNALVLHIGGERRANPLTTIRYTPDPDNSGTEYVSIKGDAAPWFEGKRFEWSGKTDRGSNFSVKVVCP